MLLKIIGSLIVFYVEQPFGIHVLKTVLKKTGGAESSAGISSDV